jgi:hypothetical protein
VGLGRFELPTSSLSGTRSNQLSYRPNGGAGRDRTGGLLSANQALSQLSYSPFGWGLGAGDLGLALLRARPGHQPLLPNKSSRPIGRCRPAPGRTSKIMSQNLKWRSEFGLWSGTAATYFTQTFRLGFSVTPPTFSLRKEVIQPQVLLRLPCYDFTPIMSHTLGRCLPCGLACRLLVQPTFVM